MNDDGPAAFMCGMLFGAFLMLAGIAVTDNLAATERRRLYLEAAEAGAGEFITDPKTGETTFHWTPEQK